MKVNFFSKYVALGTLFAMSASAAHAAVGMQIIADNDFAIFVGSENSVTRLIYQNDVPWSEQLSDLSSFTFDLESGENTFYLLGMGGGGEENLSGTINGVDVGSFYTYTYDPDTDADIYTYSISQSSDLSPYLSNYFVMSLASPSVADGTYDVSLADVQTALPNLTWGDPTHAAGDYVITQSPTGQGYHFDADTAVLYKVSAEQVDVQAVPEPSTLALLGVAAAGFFFARRTRSSFAKY